MTPLLANAIEEATGLRPSDRVPVGVYLASGRDPRPLNSLAERPFGARGPQVFIYVDERTPERHEPAELPNYPDMPPLLCESHRPRTILGCDTHVLRVGRRGGAPVWVLRLRA